MEVFLVYIQLDPYGHDDPNVDSVFLTLPAAEKYIREHDCPDHIFSVRKYKVKS